MADEAISFSNVGKSSFSLGKFGNTLKKKFQEYTLDIGNMLNGSATSTAGFQARGETFTEIG